jgi:hypothetical protein
MTQYQYVVTIIWLRFLKPIWSFLINACFWIGRLNHIRQTRREMALLRQMPLSFVMALFLWRPDGMKDWTPWVMTIVCNGLQDDCDGAAVLARWRLRHDGVRSRIVYLYSDVEGHAVCVTDDHRMFISNNLVCPLTSPDWRKEILGYYLGHYNTVID